MTQIKYKDYRIGEHIFTVKFVKYEKSIEFSIMPVHDHPKNKWGRIKEWFFVKIYTSAFWYSEISTYTLKEKVIVAIKELIDTMESSTALQKQWDYL